MMEHFYLLQTEYEDGVIINEKDLQMDRDYNLYVEDGPCPTTKGFTTTYLPNEKYKYLDIMAARSDIEDEDKGYPYKIYKVFRLNGENAGDLYLIIYRSERYYPTAKNEGMLVNMESVDQATYLIKQFHKVDIID